MLRAYLRHEPRCTLSSQKTALDDLGKKIAATYIEPFPLSDGKLPERNRWIGSLRTGDLAVVSDFHRLATNAADLKTVRATIKATGAVILEARTERRSDDPEALGDMIQESLDFYARRGMITAEAQRLGKLGAANSPKARPTPGRMPPYLARPIWRNPDFLTWEAALAAINADPRYKAPYSQAAAFRHLGPRGTQPGPRRKPEKPKRGWVYFIQDGKDGPIKIGYSKDPQGRMHGIMTGNQSGELKTLFVVRGTYGTEKKFHARFAKLRKVREWFHYDGALKRFILKRLAK